VVAYLGAGIRYRNLMREAMRFGPCAAICDVDSEQLRKGADAYYYAAVERGVAVPQPDLYEDYRHILDRSDIDAVVISTPDHWHTKIAIEALHAGKDVYCEKPLTIRVAEGPLILDALAKTGRVMQVGTQQRSGTDFQNAAAMARAERAGKVKRITCGLGGAPGSPELPIATPPASLNWNRWLGPAPWAEYRAARDLPEEGYGNHHPHSRAHAHFRWWYEYAGGKLTDWGAHHVDIAMWGLGKSDASIGPYTIEPVAASHPVEFVDGYPVQDDRFNVANSFNVRVTFADGVELDIVHYAGDLGFDNGIMFECERGRFFVNRGKLTGKPAEELADNPLSDAEYDALFPSGRGNAVEGGHDARNGGHVKNFFECVRTRATPISDVASHHHHLTVCHVANIALRLNRTLTYDPAAQAFVNDPQADAFLAREYRKGFEIDA
ncbi:MAG: Gfo/Idh/MocA family oxidoreductase, partial [Planctomycetota bacterium]